MYRYVESSLSELISQWADGHARSDYLDRTGPVYVREDREELQLEINSARSIVQLLQAAAWWVVSAIAEQSSTSTVASRLQSGGHTPPACNRLHGCLIDAF